MTTEQMRTRLCARYPGSAWAAKVRKMPDDQVMAVYLRLERSGELHGPKKAAIYIPACQHRTVFYCQDCKGVFSADNPSTKECRYCGSTRLSATPPTIKIEKGTSDEN